MTDSGDKLRRLIEAVEEWLSCGGDCSLPATHRRFVADRLKEYRAVAAHVAQPASPGAECDDTCMWRGLARDLTTVLETRNAEIARLTASPGAEVVERVAEAICDWQEPGKYAALAAKSPYDSTTLHQEHFRIMARAALAALQPPRRTG